MAEGFQEADARAPPAGLDHVVHARWLQMQAEQGVDDDDLLTLVLGPAALSAVAAAWPLSAPTGTYFDLSSLCMLCDVTPEVAEIFTATPPAGAETVKDLLHALACFKPYAGLGLCLQPVHSAFSPLLLSSACCVFAYTSLSRAAIDSRLEDLYQKARAAFALGNVAEARCSCTLQHADGPNLLCLLCSKLCAICRDLHVQINKLTSHIKSLTQPCTPSPPRQQPPPYWNGDTYRVHRASAHGLTDVRMML